MTEQEKRLPDNVLELQAQNQGYGTCYKCGLPWNQCKPKTVMCSENEGIFALCTYCWDNSDTEERLHHYRSLWLDHKNRFGHVTDWNRIETEIRNQ